MFTLSVGGVHDGLYRPEYGLSGWFHPFCTAHRDLLPVYAATLHHRDHRRKRQRINESQEAVELAKLF